MEMRNPTEFGHREATGFTLVEVMIVLTVLAILATIAVPAYARYRTAAQTTACISNLRQLDHAKQQWSFECRRAGNPTPDMRDLLPYLQSGREPRCPASGQYRVNELRQHPTCTLAHEGHTLSQADSLADTTAKAPPITPRRKGPPGRNKKVPRMAFLTLDR